jgi:hypothetical protein
MDLSCLSERWLTVIALVGLFTCTGCADAAKLVQETEVGGVVTYLYKADRGGPVMSPHRLEALELIKKKCGSGYLIVREGEAQSNRSISGIVEGTEDEARNRRWGLQFRCKTA